jgi:catechol 2,3-dioxygenase-like lactoylglutathione lyase family enzyme
MSRNSFVQRLWLTLAAVAGLVIILTCGPVESPPPAEPEPMPEISDALAPTTSGENAPIRQLHTVTLCTTDLEATRAFYGDGLGLRVRGPIEISPDIRDLQLNLWGIPDDVGWELYLMDRPTVPGTIQVRVLVLDRETPSSHTTWDPQEPGPFSMGFPTSDLDRWDAELRGRGYESLMPLSRYQIPRPDGTLYGIHETIFNAPDFVHAVTISRRDGMPQLGPVDPATGRGGPIYSAHIIENSDEVLDFYVEVLGLELRSDRQFKSSGSKGALGVPDGTEFRFSIVYAEGARFGHLLFLDYQGRLGLPNPLIAPRPPNRGLAMWTFPVRDIREMASRLAENGFVPFAGPVEYESPSLGTHRAMTVLDPNGFLVELFQPLE